jgi:hypothetical protein
MPSALGQHPARARAVQANARPGRDAGAPPFSLLFLELSGYCANAAQLHVNAADVLVRRGIDGTASDNRRYGRP